MLQLVVGLATISAAASLFAWLCDEETKKEKRKHEKLRRENGSARARYRNESAAFAQYKYEKERDYALERKRLFEQQASSYLNDALIVKKDMDTLRINLNIELSQPHLSPYRRNALKQLFNRVEDATNRLNAYQLYCDWYLKELSNMETYKKFNDIINFDYPEPKLPADWFYVGKVGLVERVELIGGKNRFGRTLQLDKIKDINGSFIGDPIQQLLAQVYPDQDAIPVQIIKVSQSGFFFSACIKRGAIHVDHILEKSPCTAIVERDIKGKEPSYLVSIFPAFFDVPWKTLPKGGIRALLPRSETHYPGKNYQAGDKLEVFPFQYDLLLTDYHERDSHIIIVTERESSLDFEQESVAPVYLCINQMLADLPSLEKELAADAQWQFQNCYEGDCGEFFINFQLGNWSVKTASYPSNNYLMVIALTPTDPNALEQTTLPFELELIEKELLDDIFLDEQQLQKLKAFSLEQSNYEQRDNERHLAWQFFERWNKVADYLLAKDGFISVEFNPVNETDNEVFFNTGDEELDLQIKLLSTQVEKKSKFGKRCYLPLEQAYLDVNGVEMWLKVADLNSIPCKLGKQYKLDINNIDKLTDQTSRAGFIPVNPRRMRLHVRKDGDYSNLKRQKQAVESFVLDKLLNKSLKQIVIDPAGYQGHIDTHWQQKIDMGLTWQNEQWREIDRGNSTKKIIENALMESNLYLIQGPPGTGKTTCIVELLHQLYTDNPSLRILVVSQQNTAVDNALTRFIEKSPQLAVNLLRVGKNDKIDETLRNYSSEQRLKAYYESRVHAYQEAVVSDSQASILLKGWLDSIRDDDGVFDVELSELLIGEFNLVGATCVGLAGQRHGLHRLMFDVAIIDEAGRSTVPELLIPILRSRKVILIGDHFQLPPSIAASLREEVSIDALPFLQETFLKESFFEVLFHGLPLQCKGRLTEQFRMTEPIGDLVAELFYQTDGQRGLFNGKKHNRADFFDADAPLRWEDVHGRQEADGSSKKNKAEADAVCDFLQKISAQLEKRKKHKEVAIITPYSGQKRLIRRMTKEISSNNDAADQSIFRIGCYLTVRIDTVDSFQGSEADIVMYSTVRTSGNISFIQDRQRLNVSCSRARENLIFFGDAKFLQRAEQQPQYSSENKLFTAIIQHSILNVVPLIVTIYHIPNQGSRTIFAKCDSRQQYLIRQNIAPEIALQDWLQLKVGDRLAITIPNDSQYDAKAIPATSARRA
jgi:hypothetical protein